MDPVKGNMRVGEAHGAGGAGELGFEGSDEDDAVGCLDRLTVEMGAEAGVFGASGWQLTCSALAGKPERVRVGAAEVAGA